MHEDMGQLMERKGHTPSASSRSCLRSSSWEPRPIMAAEKQVRWSSEGLKMPHERSPITVRFLPPDASIEYVLIRCARADSMAEVYILLYCAFVPRSIWCCFIYIA
jgi:hypothetical protein